MEGLSDDAVLEAGMRAALVEAKRAQNEDEVPVGCVLLDVAGRILRGGRNATNATRDPTQHAELVALAPLLASPELLREVHTLVVTIEPCVMCAAALRMLPFGHRLERVVFGARNERFGGAGSVANVLQREDVMSECGLTERGPVKVVEGLMRDEAVAILKDFYSKENVKYAPEEKRRKK